MVKENENKKSLSMNWTRSRWAEIALSLGVALLIASYVRYSIQGELLRFSEILLIAGGVLVLGSIVLGFPNVRNYFSKRSSQLGTNTTILMLAVIGILIVVNYLGYTYHKRLDMTTEHLYTLSEQSKKIVSGLKQDVNVVRFAKTKNQQVDDLMTEYTDLNSHVKYQMVDPQEKPEVAQEYGAQHMDDVIAASGTHKEPIKAGADGGITEEDVTSAILKVTTAKVKTVCFVTGHGEKSLTDNGPGGYSSVDDGLKKEGYDTKSVNLVTGGAVPSDCDALVVAGPMTGYFPQETAMIQKYLDNGGKALIEDDPVSQKGQQDANLEAVYKDWNIDAGNNVILDGSPLGSMFGMGKIVPLVVDYGDSPITKDLTRRMTLFPLARTVSIADKSKMQSDDVELLKTSPQSYTIPNLKEVKFDPKTDTAGPLSIGVAATKQDGDKQARLVVIGNSLFAANRFIGLQMNGDLFFNTVDWLAQDSNLISIRPKSTTDRRVTLTQAQSTFLWWLDLILLPGIVIVSGIVIWVKRR